MTAHLIGVTGVPGTGKSYFARSARDLGKTAVAVCDPKEVSFYGANDVTLFADLEWRPHLGQFHSTAMSKLLTWLDACGKDADLRYVVIDPVSEVSDFAMREVLKVHATNDPSDVEYGRAYTAHDQQIKTLMTELRRLFAVGKTVICTFHGQMKELEGQGTAKAVGGFKGKAELKFDEQLLPVMATNIRQRIQSPFDLWLYTMPQGFGPARRYYVTAQADAQRPAKHSVAFKPGTNLAMIGNSLKELLSVIQEPTP